MCPSEPGGKREDEPGHRERPLPPGDAGQRAAVAWALSPGSYKAMVRPQVQDGGGVYLRREAGRASQGLQAAGESTLPHGREEAPPGLLSMPRAAWSTRRFD
jgi:hypothetical protein